MTRVESRVGISTRLPCYAGLVLCQTRGLGGGDGTRG